MIDGLQPFALPDVLTRSVPQCSREHDNVHPSTIALTAWLLINLRVLIIIHYFYYLAPCEAIGSGQGRPSIVKLVGVELGDHGSARQANLDCVNGLNETV